MTIETSPTKAVRPRQCPAQTQRVIIPARLKATLLTFALVWGSAGGLGAADTTMFFQNTIWNRTGNNANDLRADFGSGVAEAKLVQGTNSYPGGPPHGGWDGSQIDFPNFGSWNLSNGQPIVIRWATTNFGTGITTNSQWTLNGNVVGNLGPLDIGGCPFFIAEWMYSKVGAFIENKHEVPVRLTNVRGYKDNQLAHYILAQAFEPSGSLLPGYPQEVLLAPSQTFVVSFEDVSNQGYELILAEAERADRPGEFFSIGLAVRPQPLSNPIPTLSEWGLILLLVALVGTGAVYLWRRQTPVPAG